MLQFLHEPHAAGQSTMNATKKTNRAGRQTKGVVPSVALVSILSSPGYRWKRRCSSFLFTRTFAFIFAKLTGVGLLGLHIGLRWRKV